MADAVVPLRHHTVALALFGPGDENLRKLCQQTGAQVVLRGSEIRITGDEEQVAQCQQTLQRWMQLLKTQGTLYSSDVSDILPEPVLQGDSGETHMIHSDVERLASDVQSEIAGNRYLTDFRSGKDRVGSVRPKTEGQKRYMEAMRKSELVFCNGPAGCGKTYLAVAMALEALRREQVRKLVLVRPAVEAGEKLGYLPGDMFAKVNPFLRPLLDAIHDMLEYEQVRRYMANDVIEIVPLAFMRGRTLNDTFMILDEGQNTTITQMKMFLTRMGVNSRIVVTGDATQNDLSKGVGSGFLDGMQRLSSIGGVAIIHLTGQDIVRHRLVREIVSAYEATETTG
ncbi:MAG: PhoH family protein [Planctomycetaceae bacterium]|nr:PhoH family protein [Planctomycetaceae bacterium]